MNARADLEQTIAALEAQRATLGDAVVDVSVAALREKLSDLRHMTGSERPVTGERKTLTVVLADVQGSTDLAERLSMEAWVMLMDQLFQILQAEIYRYGGQVNQFRGDGILAFFGVSQTHEDDPERAVLAGLAMQEAVAVFAAEFAASTGLALRLRVGINTGEVIVTSVGEGQRYSVETAMGRTIALAARMESAADAGTVLVAEATYRLIRSQFEWLSLGAINVKGIHHPVEVYRPLAHRPQARRQHGLPGLASPLIGRERELLALQTAVRRLQPRPEQMDSGCIVTLVGEAGLGKSRLVAELHQWVDRQVNRPLWQTAVPGALSGKDYGSSDMLENGAGPMFENGKPNIVLGTPRIVWMEGRCVSYASSSGYWLWADVVRNLLNLSAEISLRALSEDLDRRILARYPDCSDATLQGLTQLVLQHFETDTKARGRFCDAQDNSSGLGSSSAYGSPNQAEDDDVSERRRVPQAVIDLIELASAKAPVLIVCEDLHWVDATSLQLLTEMFSLTARLPVAIVVTLRPTENPLYQRILTEAGVYHHVNIPLLPLSIPESAALIERLLRANTLPEDLRARVLAIGEGNPFYLEEILRALMDEGAIVYDPVKQGWFATRKVDTIAIPDTLQGILQARIDRLPLDTKAVLQIAAVTGRIFQYALLEALVPAPEDLMYHLELLQACTLIREQNAVTSRTEGAIVDRAGEGAADLEQGPPWMTSLQTRTYIFKHQLTQQAAYQSLLERDRRRLHRAVAEAIKHLHTHSLWPHADVLAYHWERTDESSHAIPHLIRAGDDAGLRGANEEARQYLHRALTLARGANLKLGEAEALARLGFVARHAGDFEGARADLTAAVDIYELFGNQRRVAPLLVELALIARRRGVYAEAEQHLERVLDISRHVHNPRDEVQALIDLTRLYRQRGAVVRAVSIAESALNLSRALQYRSGETLACVELGAALRDIGDFEASHCHLQAGLHAHEDQNNAYGIVETLIELSWLNAGMEQFSEARRCAERAVTLAEELRSRWRIGEAELVLGWALYRLGHIELAEAAYQHALALRTDLREEHLTVEPLAGLAAVCLQRGDLPNAYRHIDIVLRHLNALPELEGTRQPFSIYLTCYDVLTAAGDARAPEILTRAQRLLHERAGQIRKPTDCRRFLECVPAHRRLNRLGTLGKSTIN